MKIGHVTLTFVLSLWSAAAVCAGERPGGASSAQPGLLFVQSVSSGSFEGDTLTLRDGDPLILYFSDRPGRFAGHMTAARFLRLWQDGRDNFKENPPNAVISILSDQSVKNVVAELFSPSVDGGTWKYKVKILSGELPGTFASASLFIDAFPAEQVNVKVEGDAPAVAMGSLYQATAQALANASHNAAAQAQTNASTRTAVTTGAFTLSALRASTGPLPQGGKELRAAPGPAD